MRSLLVQRQSFAAGRALPAFALGVLGCMSLACGSSSPSTGQAAGGSGPLGNSSQPQQQEDAGTASPEDSGQPVTGQPGPGDDASVPANPDSGAISTLAGDGGTPKGWLYTTGAKIYVSNGNGGTAWMGRGVNMDDIFLCGYNSSLSMTTPDKTLEAIVMGLISGWKPNFIRISLAMDTNSTVASWLTNPTQYKTPMTNVINAIGANAGVYVLVTLRSDASMILYDTTGADKEATGLPSNSTNTPDKTKYPTGTDAVYVALVDTFANSSFVLFGLTNEPGGSTQTAATDSKALSHAVGTIRAEEDRLGVPHHIVSVQGSGWSSDVSSYAKSPLPYDNLVYEIHGYPPKSSAYTYSNIPVILGEYGSLTSSSQAAFYADLEQKQISNLAWDFEPYSACAPDLLNVTKSSSSLQPSSWGSIVQSYLAAH
jgi:Cellulase (glycosyl hydrolase family 5)